MKEKPDRIVADYGTGHRESRMAAGEEPTYFVEHADGSRVEMVEDQEFAAMTYEQLLRKRQEHTRMVFQDKMDDCIELDPDRALRSFKTETVSSVAAMQMRAGCLFSEMIQGKIRGYRVEMDRASHPATFHITTWK